MNIQTIQQLKIVIPTALFWKHIYSAEQKDPYIKIVNWDEEGGQHRSSIRG